MSLIQKIGVGLASMTGVSTAVGVPLGVKYSRGGQLNLYQASFSVCDPQYKEGLEEISYGQNTNKKVCGGLEDSKGNSPERDTKAYEEFFRDNGDRTNEKLGGLGDRWGTRQCMGEGVQSPGALVVSGTEEGGYLGLCEGSDISTTKFIKKKMREGEEVKSNSFSLGTCDKDCGSLEEKVSEVQTFKQERGENGKEVKFYIPK